MLALALLAGGCANNVVVQGAFPEPVLDQLPYTIGVYYPPEFAKHKFRDAGKTIDHADWTVKTGKAQMRMHNTLLSGMFEKVVALKLSDIPGDGRARPVKGRNANAPPVEVDAILVPHVDEFQYSTPGHTRINVFEVWMRYRYELHAPDGELLADWVMTSYGKTPSAFMKSPEDAVNLAAVVALRDAGANFAMNFARVPEVRMWMDSVEDARSYLPGTGTEAQ